MNVFYAPNAIAGAPQYQLYMSNSGANGVDFVLTGEVSAVPEPSTWAMMILGFAGLGIMAYRRRGGAMIAA